jgi:indole-3-glycerol phosphate synthase
LLTVLLELHDEEELGHVCEETELIGINNRSLEFQCFSVEFKQLAKQEWWDYYQLTNRSNE